MANRLPIPGQDNGTWGQILNNYLMVSHDADGTLKDGGIQQAKLDSSVQASVSKANSSVQSINSKLPTNGGVTLTASDVGAIPDSETVVKLAESSTTIAYNPNGSIASYTIDGGQFSLNYSPDNTIRSIVRPNNDTETFTYDLAGNITSSVVI